MSVLLARTADRLYWGARYIERAEDTARIVRAYQHLVVDYASVELLRWEPLAVLAGVSDLTVPSWDPSGEATVVAYLLADQTHLSSIVSSVRAARENLRTTREVMPREAWQSINELARDVEINVGSSLARQRRDPFLANVVAVSRRLDGILESTMTRSAAYHMLRLGRLIERADMTTRVVGVAAAGLLQLQASGADELIDDEVRWMNVLRSVSALQMYQRAARGPIDGMTVVQFLLNHAAFPRSVRGCLDAIRFELAGLPSPNGITEALANVETVLADSDPAATDGGALDAAMDRVQLAIAALDAAIRERYVTINQ